MSLSVSEVEAALNSSGFAVVEGERDGPFGSWYFVLEHEPRLRLAFDGRDRWLTIEWETDRFLNDLRQWDPIWIGKTAEDLSLPMVLRMLESALRFPGASSERHRRR